MTLELKNDKTLNFLNLIILDKNNNKSFFDMFRKPTHIGTVMDNTSSHPTTHKLAAFNCYLEHLLNILLQNTLKIS